MIARSLKKFSLLIGLAAIGLTEAGWAARNIDVANGIIKINEQLEKRDAIRLASVGLLVRVKTMKNDYKKLIKSCTPKTIQSCLTGFHNFDKKIRASRLKPNEFSDLDLMMDDRIYQPNIESLRNSYNQFLWKLIKNVETDREKILKILVRSRFDEQDSQFTEELATKELCFTLQSKIHLNLSKIERIYLRGKIKESPFYYFQFSQRYKNVVPEVNRFPAKCGNLFAESKKILVKIEKAAKRVTEKFVKNLAIRQCENIRSKFSKPCEEIFKEIGHQNLSALFALRFSKE